MKKFTKILICLILCVFTLSLVACGKKDDFVYPSASSVTYGNGGLVVQKGDYLYFVNGYLSADDQTDKNASYSVGALVVAKLDENGNVILNESELMDDSYYRIMSDKLCGFEATNLFIYGDYLYFASPCQENESGDNEWAKQRVDFYRIKLDKSGKVERIYRSQVNNSNLEYSYYNVGSSVYLLAYEKNTSLDNDSKSNILTCVKAGGDSVEVATNVNSVLLKDDNSYDSIVYSISDSTNSKYELYKYNLAGNSSSKLYAFDSSVEVKEVTNGYIYITKTGRNEEELLRSPIDSINFESICYSGLYDNVFISPDANVVIAVSDGKFEFYLYQDSNPSLITVEDSDASSLTFVGFNNGSLIYIDSSKNIKSISYAEVLGSKTPEVVTIATLSSDADTTYLDMDDTYIYFYQTVGSNKYLHRIQINNANSPEAEMLGIYLEADIPETEESEEE